MIVSIQLRCSIIIIYIHCCWYIETLVQHVNVNAASTTSLRGQQPFSTPVLSSSSSSETRKVITSNNRFHKVRQIRQRSKTKLRLLDQTDENNGNTISVLNPTSTRLFTKNTTNSSTTRSVPSLMDINNTESSTVPVDNIVTRIVGGTTSQPNTAPYFTLLLTFDTYRNVWKNLGCGGSLISDRHVITAAHCIRDRSGINDAVYVNAYAPFNGNIRNNTKYPYHFSKVESYHVHPSFNDANNANDIAIITFQRPITNAKLMQFQPIRLLSLQQLTTIPVDLMSTIYGFGNNGATTTTAAAAAERSSSNGALQQINLPYRSYNQCKQYYTWKLLPDMICAGGKGENDDGDDTNTNGDACSGDSGGPMTIVMKDVGIVYQMGIVSWGTSEGCGRSTKPGVYTSIPYHYTWIQQRICDNTEDTDFDATALILCQKATTTATNTPISQPQEDEDETKESTTNIGSIFVPKNLPSSINEIKSTTTCSNGKPDGLSCNYGGECCSGICSHQSQYYTTRVCLRRQPSLV